MTRSAGPLVAIGIGNVLLRDDGVGVRVVEELRRDTDGRAGGLPRGTRLVDGGTLGLGLLEELEGARGALLVDAVDLGLAPGTITVRRGAEVAAGGAPGLHGLAELVNVARLLGLLPPSVAFVGIQVGEIDIDLALSGPVAAALPLAVDTAWRELWRLDAMAGSEVAEEAAGDNRAPAGVTR